MPEGAVGLIWNDPITMARPGSWPSVDPYWLWIIERGKPRFGGFSCGEWTCNLRTLHQTARWRRRFFVLLLTRLRADRSRAIGFGKAQSGMNPEAIPRFLLFFCIVWMADTWSMWPRCPVDRNSPINMRFRVSPDLGSSCIRYTKGSPQVPPRFR